MKRIAKTVRRDLRAGFQFPATAAAAVVACIVLLTWQLAPAQQPGAEPDAPRYTVELIVFTYRAGDGGGNEIFVPDKPTLVPDADEAEQEDASEPVFSDVPLGDMGQSRDFGNPADAGAPENPERQRIELRVLDAAEHSMGDIYAKLERLDAYVPILHTAWTQTTHPREVSPAIHLRALGNPPPGLDGSLTLYLGRYLHLVVDLALDAEPRRQSLTATDRLVAYGDEPVPEEESSSRDFGDIPDRAVRYRIVEDRIMRTGDLRYFDHPRFGVIAKVTRPAGNRDERDGASPSVTNP